MLVKGSQVTYFQPAVAMMWLLQQSVYSYVPYVNLHLNTFELIIKRV